MVSNIEKIRKFTRGEEFLIKPDNSGYGSKSVYSIDTKSYRYAVFRIDPSEINEFHKLTEFTTGYWMRFKDE